MCGRGHILQTLANKMLLENYNLYKKFLVYQIFNDLEFQKMLFNISTRFLAQ